MKIIFPTFREARAALDQIQVDNTPSGCLYLVHEGSRPEPFYTNEGLHCTRYIGGTGRWLITDCPTGEYVSLIAGASS